MDMSHSAGDGENRPFLDGDGFELPQLQPTVAHDVLATPPTPQQVQGATTELLQHLETNTLGFSDDPVWIAGNHGSMAASEGKIP